MKLSLTSVLPLAVQTEPSCASQALKSLEWRRAISDEFDALIRNETWDLVTPHSSHNVVGCKLVFRIKHSPDGSISKHKAHFVAKGFHQRPGLDYTDTFSLVVKTTTIRVLLSITAWYNELRQFLLQTGFVNSHSDTSLFIFNANVYVIFLLVYVDDTILIGSDGSLVDEFVLTIAHHFSIKDLGALSFFLSVEVHSCSHGLFLSQQKYVTNLLNRTKMIDAKLVSTPLLTNQSLKLLDGTSLTDATEFRQEIGALQYLPFTHPDIAFAVNKLAQFMHRPTIGHWSLTKSLLRYLRGTLSYDLLLRRDSPISLHVFYDTDWAGNQDDRTSTSAYVVFLSSTAIFWCSRKQCSIARSST
ncbi:hypothetical protein Q3G72_021763 [Acer saccharum]|nr:hypothetical protein Q3G72_021763 [Acer saccharum]